MSTSTALATLADYEAAERFNVLHPVVQIAGGGAGEAISPLLVESVSVVQIAAGEDSADVYNDYRYANKSKGLWALSGLALAKIAAAAGVKWIPELTGVLERSRRPDGHVYVRYRAGAAVRQPNGEWHVETAEKEIDTADIAEALRDRDERSVAAGRARFGAGEIDDRVRRELLQIREHVLAHAETKAKNRVIRRLLSLKQVYSTAELHRPFAVPRLLYRPEAAEQVQIEGRRAAADLYGPTAGLGSGADAGTPPPDQSSAVADDGDTAAPVPADQPTADAHEAAGGSPDRRQDPPAAATSSEPAPEPSDDPTLNGGPHNGRRFSEVVEIDPPYLEALADGKARGTADARRLAREWLDYARPTLEGGST